MFEPDAPDFRFVPRNAKYEREWNKGWSIREAFVVSGNGIKTERDGVSIHFSRKEIQTAVNDFRLLADYELRQKYNLEKDSRDWSVDRAKSDVNANKDSKLFKQILYRPFDVRHTWFSGKSKGFIGTPASALMHHFIAGENIGFITTRQTKEEFGVLASSLISGHKSCAAYDINTVFPLYLYPNGESEAQAELVPHENGRRPNLSAEFVKQFAETVGLKFVPDGRGDLKKTFGPEDVFNYAYAIFHSLSYRERYVEFLKIDFPRVLVTENYEVFKGCCKLGAKLVALHAFKEAAENDVSFDVPGSNQVEHINFITENKAASNQRDSPWPGSHQCQAVFRGHFARRVADADRRLSGVREVAQKP